MHASSAPQEFTRPSLLSPNPRQVTIVFEESETVLHWRVAVSSLPVIVAAVVGLVGGITKLAARVRAVRRSNISDDRIRMVRQTKYRNCKCCFTPLLVVKSMWQEAAQLVVTLTLS
jgi:hypothetical protein